MANVFREELVFGGLHNSFAENRVPKDRAWSQSNCSVERGILEARAGYALFGARTGVHPGDVGFGFAYGKYSNDAVHTIAMTGTVTAGTFPLTFMGQSALGLPFDATASQIQVALENLSNILIGDVLVEGGPLPVASVKVTWKGQYANTNVPLMTTSSAGLTGGTVGVSETVKGGTAEEYLAIVQSNGSATATLYAVDPVSGVFTQIATNLHASDWFMIQYGNKMYGVNGAQGMFAKVIGTSSGAVTAFSRPAAPPLAPPSSILGNSARFVSTSGLSFGGFSGFGTNPTTSVTGSGTVNLTLNANIPANTELSLEYTWTGNQDFSRDDPWVFQISTTKNTNLNGAIHLKTKFEFINAAAAGHEPPVYGSLQTQQTGALGRYLHWQGAHRQARQTIRKIRITFFVDVSLAAGTDSITIQPIRGSQWPNDLVPLNVDNSPTARSIEYAYSYLDAASQLESDLSPVVTTASLPPTNNKWGAFVRLNFTLSSQLTSADKIYVYRRERSTGKMRRLPNLDGSVGIANTGSPTFDDPYLESELAGFAEFGEGQVGLAASQLQGVAVQIATWKQCLVVAARRQAYISDIGKPQTFQPSPDDANPAIPDEEERDIGRTDYVSDNRAEEVFGLVGQDTLYATTALSSYAMVGDSPAEAANFRRLPGSRGAVGPRATYALGGGIEVASQDGLWYYSVGRGFSGDDNGALLQREETADVRRSWDELTAGTGCVVAEHQDEIWIFQGLRYLHNTRTRRWNAGTFADSVKVAVANRVRGLKFMDARGRIMSLSKAFTTDNGTPISWFYETGWLDSPRVHIKGMECHGTGASTIKVYSQDGANAATSPVTLTKDAARVRVGNFSVPPAFRYKLRFEGASSAVTIESAVLLVEKAPDGGNN